MPAKYPTKLKTRALRLLTNHLENNPIRITYTACKENAELKPANEILKAASA